MKALSAAIAASVILLAGSFTAPEASAQDIRIGPGGVRIEDRDRDRWDRRDRWDDRWDRRDRCRTVIERRRDRFGDWVETRRRICR